jgi:hypothetical protein
MKNFESDGLLKPSAASSSDAGAPAQAGYPGI